MSHTKDAVIDRMNERDFCLDLANLPPNPVVISRERFTELLATEADNALLAERLTAAELERDELGARAERAEAELEAAKGVKEAVGKLTDFISSLSPIHAGKRSTETAISEIKRLMADNARLRAALEYDGDTAELAAKTWEQLATFEGEDSDAQLIIERAITKAVADLRSEIDSIENQIGHIGPNEHPDEQKPRAETWLDERKNWQAEVERLRGWNGRAEIVLEKWRVLCEMGLQDVCSEFARPSVEQLWELTDELVPSEKTKARAALGEGK